jgi:hypothetical protein
MFAFKEFKEIFVDNVYSTKKLDNQFIIDEYDKYHDSYLKSSEITSRIIYSGNDYDEFGNFSNLFFTEEGDPDFEMFTVGIENYIRFSYKDNTISKDGFCLLEDLIGKACQLIGTDMYGVVRSYDPENPENLFVDFLEPEEVKVNINELRIVGIK